MDKKLRERYDHMKTMVLPQVQYAWQHLRLQDYKSSADYILALFDIVIRFKLCGVKITEAEILEKTFFIFHTSNIVLHQQYWHREFKAYSKLFSVLLTAK